MKKYQLSDYFEGDSIVVAPVKRNYINNGRLAIELVDVDAEWPFAYLTVNISYPLSNNDDVSLAFIDTNNNEWAEEFIKSNGLGEPTGHIGYSGYCSYPEYRMNLGKINKEEELFNGK